MSGEWIEDGKRNVAILEWKRNSSRIERERMRARLTVHLDDGDKITATKVMATLKGLGIECSSGDEDGREWVMIWGDLTPDDLYRVASGFSRTPTAK